MLSLGVSTVVTHQFPGKWYWFQYLVSEYLFLALVLSGWSVISATAMRASDVDLVKLKCQKCEFQAVHPHQLQQHLSDEHTDELGDLVRCRCCNFLFFAEDDLKEHFKACYSLVVCDNCTYCKPPFGWDILVCGICKR